MHTCSICLCQINCHNKNKENNENNSDDHMSILPCGHIYCFNCINNWLNKSNPPTCPTCKNNYKPNNIVKFKDLDKFPEDEFEIKDNYDLFELGNQIEDMNLEIRRLFVEKQGLERQFLKPKQVENVIPVVKKPNQFTDQKTQSNWTKNRNLFTNCDTSIIFFKDSIFYQNPSNLQQIFILNLSNQSISKIELPFSCKNQVISILEIGRANPFNLLFAVTEDNLVVMIENLRSCRILSKNCWLTDNFRGFSKVLEICYLI